LANCWRDAATAQRAIRIRLLDDTYIVRAVNTEVFVKDLLRYVTGQLSLRETAYFGLATLREGAVVSCCVFALPAFLLELTSILNVSNRERVRLCAYVPERDICSSLPLTD